VWVARGKHAHYPSRASCDAGHWFYDTCDANAVALRFPVVGARQTVGRRARPLPPPGGGVLGAALPLGALGARAGARECVWDDARPFRGWQADAVGAPPTAYGRVLRRAADL
jgi:hypothetical protein